MRFACWINKATDTHTLWICNTVFIAFPRQQWFGESTSVFCCVHWFYIRFQALTFVRSFWLCVSDWPLTFFFHSATNGSSHFINRSLAFVSNSRSARLSLSSFGALRHSVVTKIISHSLWQFCASQPLLFCNRSRVLNLALSNKICHIS